MYILQCYHSILQLQQKSLTVKFLKDELKTTAQQNGEQSIVVEESYGQSQKNLICLRVTTV